MTRRVLHCLAVCLTLIATRAASGAPNREAHLPLLEGLDALEAGKYADAVPAFSRAIEADSEDPILWVARGVANALAEKPQPAEKDFLRAQRLDPQDRQVRLWLAFVYQMQGDFQKSSVTHPGATRDPYDNLVMDIGRLYGTLAFATRSGSGDNEVSETFDLQRGQRAQALARFPELAAAFANRVKGSTGDLAPLLAERARQLMTKGDWAAALAALEKAQQTRPNDTAILNDRAVCNLNLGAAGAAREQFTLVLTADPRAAGSFAGRATAAAVLGDVARAKSDLEHATRLDPSHAADYQRAVDDAVRNNPAVQVKRAELPKKVDELVTAARDNASEDDLLARATAIIKGTNAYRLRSDETYFDRRLRLEIKAHSGDPAALADLGEFLYREAMTAHVEKVEPRAEPVPYRPQDRDAELRYAEQCCDRALAASANHVKGLTFKSFCLMARRQWGDAEALLRRALAIDPTYGPLLEGMSKLLNHAAAVRAQKAYQLRQTETWETTYWYYWRPPSAADLAEADALDREARRLWELARGHLQAAAARHTGQPLGHYYTGSLATHENRPDDARAAFEACVRLEPAFQSAWDELAVLYANKGLAREPAEAKSRSVNLVHTTAGHMLRYAWGNIPRAKYKTAADALRRAIEYDPADPRACAYLGAVALADEKPDDALGYFRAAAALDEARSALNGTSLRSAGGAAVPSASTGFTMSLNNRLGRLALDRDRPDVAVEACRRNVALERRVPRGEWFTPLPVSMLPDTDPGELGTVPEADAAVSLFMQARTTLGLALLKQGKADEAMAQFRTVLAMPAARHATQPPVNRCTEPWLRAKMAVVRSLMDRKDWDGAWREATHGEWGGGAISKELQAEWRAMSAEIEKRRAAARNDDFDRSRDQSREEVDRRTRELQQRLAEQTQRRREELERMQRERQQQQQQPLNRNDNARQRAIDRTTRPAPATRPVR